MLQLYKNQLGKMSQNMISNLVVELTNSNEKADNIDILTKNHQAKALEFYNDFQTNFISNLQAELKEISNALHIQLGRTIRKLENKLRGFYSNSLSQSINMFFLEKYVTKEVKAVFSAVDKLKEKIHMYIGDFCENVLNENIDKQKQMSLYHFSNNIRSQTEKWNSVTSRCPFSKAFVEVKGFHRPQTTWVAVGVSKKMKELGPMKAEFEKQDFMGNIYLNGSQTLNKAYRTKKDLNQGDTFIVQCNNRMLWVYRKHEGRSQKQTFIMDDNKEGPIQLSFVGQK